MKVPVPAPYPVEKYIHIPVEKKVPYPVHKPVDKPVQIELEKHTPFRIEKPLAYSARVHVPVKKDDYTGSESKGLSELSGGYAS